MPTRLTCFGRLGSHRPLRLRVPTYRLALANSSIICFQNSNDLFVQFFASYEDAQYIYIAMELMQLGDLGNYIHDRWHEGDVGIVAHQLLCGLQYLHQNQITHRDLKPVVSTITFKSSQNNILICLLLHIEYIPSPAGGWDIKD